MPPPDAAVLERFHAKCVADDFGDCVLWVAGKRRGYGNFWLEGKPRAAHRLAYQWWRGPIPEGLTLDHLCRLPACVNPWHLEAVTNTVNILRGTAPSAKYAKATHCIHGHEFTEENTYVYPGHRRCRTCIFDRQRERRARARSHR
jgi:hypothetical protein